MEQAQRKRAHLERILLICGQQNAGKSSLLRAMLGDKRLGGIVPTGKRITPRALSRERCLYIRATSPHETKEKPQDFYAKIDQATALAWSDYWRVNYVSPVQPKKSNNMPDIVTICEDLIKEFKPERIRIVQLVPDYNSEITSQLPLHEIEALRKLGVEVIAIDARKSSPDAQLSNVRILADFFDFS